MDFYGTLGDGPGGVHCWVQLRRATFGLGADPVCLGDSAFFSSHGHPSRQPLDRGRRAPWSHVVLGNTAKPGQFHVLR